MIFMLLAACVILFALIIRVAWIQFVDGGELQSLAYEQQTLDRKINPKRGVIYEKFFFIKIPNDYYYYKCYACFSLFMYNK